MTQTRRSTVELTGYPDLVVIYLGMRARTLRGMATLLGFGPRIGAAVRQRPDGLLLHENLAFSLFPLHLGMRQYWRDLESLERWSRSMPHRGWWQRYVRDTAGTDFWHETYFIRGGMEAIYDDVGKPVGMMRFAPVRPARGSMFSARRRLGLPARDETTPVRETELYG
jgi:hypothetical protein